LPPLLGQAPAQGAGCQGEPDRWLSIDIGVRPDVSTGTLFERRPLPRFSSGLHNYRPEYQHGWGGKTYYSQVRLDTLPPESAGELLQALLGEDPGLQPLTQLLIERTEGNPFFLEESVRALIDTKALVGARAPHHRHDDVPRHEHDVLAGEGGGGDARVGMTLLSPRSSSSRDVARRATHTPTRALHDAKFARGPSDRHHYHSANRRSEDLAVTQNMTKSLSRRSFVAGISASAVLSPLAADAQQASRVPKVGVLWPNPPSTFEFVRQGLSDHGFVEGRTVSFEYRWAEGKLGQLPELAAELVRLKVDVILTLAPPATHAAKNATQTIPIVFLAIGDPVAGGLVSSLAHPGGNLTGTTRMTSEMSVKHLELLKDMVPSLSQVCILWNPGNSAHAPALKAMESTVRSLRLRLRLVEIRRPDDLDDVSAAFTRDRPDAVVFLPDPIFFIHLRRMVDLFASSRLPAISLFTEFPKLGGLMGYAPSIPDEFRRAATHLAKILKGAKPGDLPVEEPTKFELVINVKTAKALGLTIPPSLLLRADQVIE
jgi:putative ABC transport system substrate-binding protein